MVLLLGSHGHVTLAGVNQKILIQHTNIGKELKAPAKKKKKFKMLTTNSYGGTKQLNGTSYRARVMSSISPRFG